MLDAPPVPDLLSHLRSVGTVFASFTAQDSGCVAYGVVEPGGARWFVKAAVTERAVASMERAAALHAAVRHEAIVPQLHRFTAAGLPAVVMPWRDGEVLYHPTTDGGRGTAARTDPASPTARFRSLPVPLVAEALDTVLDAHLAVARAGFVACDFYDGCLLYDFARHRLHLCDLDEYRPGPFTVDVDRLPGSKRFMAPEEFRRGAVIDARTTVFTLGRALRLLLDAGDEERDWRGGPARLAVLERATAADPTERWPGVEEFAAAWRAA
ncbi:serine/threonine protein kinase [Streptomyces sp. BE303]|uniref:serine/threonine protein kinase n=1 Tax=Streptomyces sp. BE303 TaxID=3002528 RepID=UPI002E7711E2|nr:serine/threonine protein kinase [Streptomyces sp. BE303]MED7948599.1 serine/threonine protein kinase [Streptomyces sp. BE303]